MEINTHRVPTKRAELVCLAGRQRSALKPDHPPNSVNEPTSLHLGAVQWKPAIGRAVRSSWALHPAPEPGAQGS